MLLAAIKAGVNSGDKARTTEAAEGKIPALTSIDGVEGAVGVASEVLGEASLLLMTSGSSLSEPRLGLLIFAIEDHLLMWLASE